MTRRLVLPLAAALVALITGCGGPTSRFQGPNDPASAGGPTNSANAGGPTSSAGPTSPTAPTAPATPTGPTGPTSPSGSATKSGAACTVHAVAGDSANGSTVCVVRGSDFTLLLHAPTGGSWSTPEISGAELGPPMPMPTPFGYVGWSFRALTAGTADVTTTRRLCPSAAPGTVQCQGMVLYRVHVRIK